MINLVAFLHNPFSGSVYHIMDLLCYLFDMSNNTNMYFMTGNRDKQSVSILHDLLDSRYENFPVKFVTMDECRNLVHKDKTILLSTKTEILDLFNLNSIFKFVYFEHLGSHKEFQMINTKTKLKILNLKKGGRFYSLYNDKLLDPLNPNDNRQPSFGSKVLSFEHGIYDKYHINKFPNLETYDSFSYHDGLHSFFSKQYNEIRPICKYENEDTIPSFDMIFKQERISRFEKTENDIRDLNLKVCKSYMENPAYQSRGLVYDRVYDYCPRTVNEFLYNKKEIKLLRCTTGFYYFQDCIRKRLSIGVDTMIDITKDDILDYKHLVVDEKLINILNIEN